MQSLLEERFKLKVHRETRELPIYALVLARKDGRLGPELKVSTVDCAASAARGQGPSAARAAEAGRAAAVRSRWGSANYCRRTDPLLSSLASALVGRRCSAASSIDRALPADYDLDAEVDARQLPQRAPGTPADQPFRMNGVEIDPNGPSIFTAVQEQLGLKLDANARTCRGARHRSHRAADAGLGRSDRGKETGRSSFKPPKENMELLPFAETNHSHDIDTSARGSRLAPVCCSSPFAAGFMRAQTHRPPTNRSSKSRLSERTRPATEK